MRHNAIGIDVITTGLSKVGLTVSPNGNQYVVTSHSNIVDLRFEDYKQLKAFYIGYKAGHRRGE